jgi:hypothetical protein
MTAFHWKAGISGSFELASNWSTGTVPNAGLSDDALIDAPGTYTVTASLDHQVNDLSVVAGATFDIIGGEFFARTGTNSGVINNHSILQVSSSL